MTSINQQYHSPKGADTPILKVLLINIGIMLLIYGLLNLDIGNFFSSFDILFKAQLYINFFGGIILAFFKRTGYTGGAMIISAFVLVLINYAFIMAFFRM